MTNLSGIWWLETGLGKSEWRVFSCTWTLETKTGRLGRPQVTGTMETFERAGDTILVTITFARQKLDHAILVTFLKGDLIKVSVLICKLWTFSGSHYGNGPKLVANWCQEYASASVGSEMQPSPENNHPVHFFLETADLGVTAGLCLEVIVDEGCPGQSILLAENTNQDGQATGDMLELAPRQGHELTSPIPIQSWRFLQSSSPTRTRTLWVEDKSIGKNLWGHFIFIWFNNWHYFFSGNPQFSAKARKTMTKCITDIAQLQHSPL